MSVAARCTHTNASHGEQVVFSPRFRLFPPNRYVMKWMRPHTNSPCMHACLWAVVWILIFKVRPKCRREREIDKERLRNWQMALAHDRFRLHIMRFGECDCAKHSFWAFTISKCMICVCVKSVRIIFAKNIFSNIHKVYNVIEFLWSTGMRKDYADILHVTKMSELERVNDLSFFFVVPSCGPFVFYEDELFLSFSRSRSVVVCSCSIHIYYLLAFGRYVSTHTKKTIIYFAWPRTERHSVRVPRKTRNHNFLSTQKYILEKRIFLFFISWVSNYAE